MAKTKIQWAEKVWNPITGCTNVSEGCRNCYAELMANRLRGRHGYPADEPFRVTLHLERLEEPLKWKKPCRVFVCSRGDLFHDDVPIWMRFKVMDVILQAKQHIFLILTKRAINMKEYFDWYYTECGRTTKTIKNLWLGVTAENQQAADERIPILLQTPAAVRFVSIEPMLGSVDMRNIVIAPAYDVKVFGGKVTFSIIADVLQGKQFCYGLGGGIAKDHPKLDWVICGGETGPKARPMHPDWVRSLRDQCQAAGVPFFFKQWGDWAPIRRNNDTNQIYVGDGLFVTAKKFASLDKQGRDVLDLPGLWNVGDVDMAFVGKKVAGDILDGKQYHEFPEVANEL